MASLQLQELYKHDIRFYLGCNPEGMWVPDFLLLGSAGFTFWRSLTSGFASLAWGTGMVLALSFGGGTGGKSGSGPSGESNS